MDNPVSMPVGGRGRYEARDVTRLGVPLVEIVWIPAPEARPGPPLFAVTGDRIPLIADAIARYLAADGAQ
jgi:hypothetical protein